MILFLTHDGSILNTNGSMDTRLNKHRKDLKKQSSHATQILIPHSGGIPVYPPLVPPIQDILGSGVFVYIFELEILGFPDPDKDRTKPALPYIVFPSI